MQSDIKKKRAKVSVMIGGIVGSHAEGKYLLGRKVRNRWCWVLQ
jgi:hypothetical protein